MRDVGLAVVVSVVVSGLLAFWLVRQVRSDVASMTDIDEIQSRAIEELDIRRAPTVISTQVSPSGGTCISYTDLRRESRGEGEVHWAIRWVGDNVNKLCREGHTVLIRPKPSNTSPLTPPQPFHQQLIKATHGNVDTVYGYEVWMASTNGTPLFRMEDPELEIIQTRRIIAR